MIEIWLPILVVVVFIYFAIKSRQKPSRFATKKSPLNAPSHRHTPAVITAGAQISPEMFAKIYSLQSSKPRALKHEWRALFADDFLWPEYDKCKAEFERIGYKSAAWEKREKWEILLATIDNIKTSYELLNQETDLDLKWELIVDNDGCPDCKSYKGKVFAVSNAPIPGEDTHPGCRCSLLPVL